MKIVILANKDLASNLALNYLIPDLLQHDLHIFLSDQVGSNNNKPKPLIDLKFFEQDLFNTILFPSLDDNLAHQEGRKTKIKSFAAIGDLLGKPIETLNDINLESGLNNLKSIGPDIILSIRFGKILKEKAIATAKLGVINLHSGLLPEYQGVMATFWAMLNRESHYGTTLHFIDSAAIDAGPIITRNEHELDLSKSYLENVLGLYESGCISMLNAVNHLAAGKSLDAYSQTSQGQYYSFPEQAQVNQFLDRGFSLYDSQQIMRLVKAYQGDE